MLNSIIGIIAIVYCAHKFCGALDSMAKENEERNNDNWVDCRSNNGFRA